MNWNYWNMHGYDGMGFMWFWLLLIVIVVVLLAWFVKPGGSSVSHHETALDILQKRLARGEIDEQEYRRIKDTLDTE